MKVDELPGPVKVDEESGDDGRASKVVACLVRIRYQASLTARYSELEGARRARKFIMLMDVVQQGRFVPKTTVVDDSFRDCNS